MLNNIDDILYDEILDIDLPADDDKKYQIMGMIRVFLKKILPMENINIEYLKLNSISFEENLSGNVEILIEDEFKRNNLYSLAYITLMIK